MKKEPRIKKLFSLAISTTTMLVELKQHYGMASASAVVERLIRERHKSVFTHRQSPGNPQ